MRHLRHHAANRRRIGPFDDLVQAREAKPFHDKLVFHGRADHRTHVLQAKLAATTVRFLRCHYSSSAVLPRMPATASRLLSFFRASKVALITLWGFVVPIDLVSTF